MKNSMLLIIPMAIIATGCKTLETSNMCSELKEKYNRSNQYVSESYSCEDNAIHSRVAIEPNLLNTVGYKLAANTVSGIYTEGYCESGDTTPIIMTYYNSLTKEELGTAYHSYLDCGEYDNKREQLIEEYIKEGQVQACEKWKGAVQESMFTKNQFFTRTMTMDCNVGDIYLEFVAHHPDLDGFEYDVELMNKFVSVMATDTMVDNNCSKFIENITPEQLEQTGLNRYGTKIFNRHGEEVYSNMRYVPQCTR